MFINRGVGLALLVSILVFASLSSVEARLKDQTLGVPAESSECLEIELPGDFGAPRGLTLFTITSDCRFCTLTNSKIIADPSNPVYVQDCVMTIGMKEGDSHNFKISIEANGKTREYSYGLCVSATPDSNTGSGKPCDVINNNQKFFDLQINPKTIYTQAGVPFQYNVSIYSTTNLNIEVTSSSGKTWSITTTPNVPEVLTETVATRTDTQLSITAKIKNCDTLSSCTKTETVDVFVRDPPDPTLSGGFDFSILPQSITATRYNQVNYTLTINNQLQPRDFRVTLVLPVSGLRSDYTSSTTRIDRTGKINFLVTPEGDGHFYSFDVIVESLGVNATTKRDKVSISVDEAAQDQLRPTNTNLLDPNDVKNRKTNALVLSNSDINGQITFLDNLNKSTTTGQGGNGGTGSGGGSSNATKPGPAGSGFDMTTLILIIIVIVAGAVVMMFFRKKKSVDSVEEEDYYFR